MILIGQVDSPFVRRVGIALYEIPFEHRPWSTFGDADRLAAHNPPRRVPTLVLDGEEVLIESATMAGVAPSVSADVGVDTQISASNKTIMLRAPANP